jgi:hypothetical protein
MRLYRIGIHTDSSLTMWKSVINITICQDRGVNELQFVGSDCCKTSVETQTAKSFSSKNQRTCQLANNQNRDGESRASAMHQTYSGYMVK